MPCTPQHLIKRDGSIKDFDPSKIQKAVEKAGKATGEFGPAIAAEITENQVMPKIRALNVATPHIEQVQDAVEQALFESGHFTSSIVNSGPRAVMRKRPGLTLKAPLTSISIRVTGASMPTPIKAIA